MRALYLLAVCFGFVAVSSTFVAAGPCTKLDPYGAKCWRCTAPKEWFTSYANIQCSHSPTWAGGFRCNVSNCGVTADRVQKLPKPKAKQEQ